jgi:hypothetical protein
MGVERLRKLFSLKDAVQMKLWSPVVIEMTWLGAATILRSSHRDKHIQGRQLFYLPKSKVHATEHLSF